FRSRGSLYDGVRPDVHVAQNTAGRDARPGSYRAERLPGQGRIFPFRRIEQPGDGGRAVAVHGDDVGQLRGEAGGEGYFPAAGFIDCGRPDADAEIAAARGLDDGGLLDDRSGTYPAVREPADVAQCDGSFYPDRAAETAAADAFGREATADLD